MSAVALPGRQSPSLFYIKCVFHYSGLLVCSCRPISIAIETVCGYTLCVSVVFFPLLSSQWHWEQNELLHCWRQAQDKNNGAPGKRTRQQGRPASSSSFTSLRPLSFLCYYGHLSSCFSVSFSFSSLIVRPLTGRKLCTPIAMRRKTKWHFACLPLAFFYPASNTLFMVVFLCSWLFWRHCMSGFFISCLFGI